VASRRVLVTSAAVAGAASAAAAAGYAAVRVARDGGRRARVTRAARVWRLTARNSLRHAATRARGRALADERRAELEQRAAIRTAHDVVNELGHMKGALMKVGQIVSFVAESLPDDVQSVLATLQADAPPMAPSLAEQVVADELGAPPDALFLDWDPVPVAAASIGQVHRAVMPDGRMVAVKVQYPGVGDAITADLANAELLYPMFSAFTLKGLDSKALVDELRARMLEELDYRREAANQAHFARHFAGHPFIRVPAVVPERSAARVITSEWADGWTWAELLERADAATRQRAAEVVWRFCQHAVHRMRTFNGDPHPGNYRFHADGTVTFLDFGMVKTWTPGEWELLEPCLDGIIVDRDPVALVAAMESVGFLTPGHGLDPAEIYEYVSAPYQPYLSDRFTFTRDWVRDTIRTIIDVRGPLQHVIEQLNLPTSFVVLNRVVWGVSALMGKLDAEGPWRSMLLEYRRGGPPATALGWAEARWEAPK
jgi:predicted unusual protein kinase regulating ubiquinone biosynthesis (AarF/ABC1/UbiB family)